MNREILFRGKEVDNGKWVKGYLWRGIDHTYITPHNLGVDYNEDTHRITAFAKEVILETVGQYTGIDDRFEEKVFEGDYVYDEVEEEIGVIKFDEGEFVVCFGNVIDGNCFVDVMASCHVIGNIHDSPDLLGGVTNA